MRPQDRALWTRNAETREGQRILADARILSQNPQYADLSDTELIRLAYWGVSGERA